MQITSIERGKGESFYIYADGEYAIALNGEILIKSGLREGMEVSWEALEQLRTENDLRRARERALHLISFRDHSQKELYDKLRKNYSDEIARKTTDLIAEMGLIDDYAYGKNLAAELYRFKQYSPRRIAMALVSKGIDRADAEEIAAEYEDEDQTERITEVLRRKYGRRLTEPKDVLRAKAALSRLGYSYGDIDRAVSAYIDELERE